MKKKPLRTAARAVGGNLARGAVMRVQQRRRRRGRPAMFNDARNVPMQRIMPRPPQGTYALTQRQVPARVNAGMTKGATNEGVRNCEKTSMMVKGDGPATAMPGTGTTFQSIYVDASNAALWPLLAEKAKNFAGWSIRGMTFVYQAVKGSAYNGQITCGFTKDPNFNSWSSPDAVVNLPAATRFQASETQVAFPVPVSIMSQSGQALFNAATVDTESVEPTRYYAGQFGYVAEQCTDDTNIGTWHIEYQVTLEQTQLNPKSGGSQFTVTDGIITVDHRGWYAPQVASDGLSVRVSSIRPTILIVAGTHGSRQVELNDVAQTPVQVWTEVAIFAFTRLSNEKLSFPGTSISGAILTEGVDPGWSLPTPMMYTTTTTAPKRCC